MKCPNCEHDSASHGQSGCLETVKPGEGYPWCSCETPDGGDEDYVAHRYVPELSKPWQPPDLTVFKHLAGAVRDAFQADSTWARFQLLELD